MRLLLAEDDAELGAALKKGLASHGHSVEWFQQGHDAILAAQDGCFESAILDIGLPDISGIAVLKAIRTQTDGDYLPVLMLTAIHETDQKVIALDAGADDYLTKPFDLQELLARLRVLQRRAHNKRDNVLRAHGMQLDLASHVLTLEHQNKSYIPSASEFKILSLLMQRPGQLVSKARIEEELHGWDGEAESNIVEVTIYNLRKHLGKETIVNMRGVGYMVLA